MRKRLLLINVALNWGSTGKIVEGVGRLAASVGWEVYVAHGARYKTTSALNDYQISTKASEITHFIESALSDRQGLGSRKDTKRLLKVIDSIEPDIVHIHNIHGCFINYPILFTYLKEKKIPIVWTLHDCWAFTGHCVYFERVSCNKWKTECFDCPQLKEFPSSYLLDGSRRNYLLKKKLFASIEELQITTVSLWLMGIVKESFLSKVPVTVVPNGIKTDVFKPVSRFKNGIRGLLFENKKILLGVATGFGERKGIKDYVHLAERLPSIYQIVLVGVMESDKKVLSNKIISLDKTEGVDQLIAFYSNADVLLSLSYEETFGMTIIEAMACGTPAIVYDNTAQPELITEETGKVVPTGDIESLVKAIEEVCSKPKESYVDACRKHALQYDESLTYQKYLDIYEAVINNSK